MEPFTITIAHFGSVLPAGVATQTSSLPEVLAGLGALVVATIGVLIVRHLKDLSDRPSAPTKAGHPQGDGFRRAA